MNDVHYALDANDHETLVPVGETPSAADKGFGFKSSNLKEWIAEMYEHKDVPEVITISVEELRAKNGPQKIAARLKAIKSEGKPPIIVPNTFAPSDTEAFVAAIALAPEIKLLYRTGASFVSTRLGIEEIPPVPPSQLFKSSTAEGGVGSLIVIGSYIQRTTAQCEYLLEHCNSHVVHFELDVEQLLVSSQDHHDLIQWVAKNVDGVLSAGMDMVVSTSRKLE